MDDIDDIDDMVIGYENEIESLKQKDTINQTVVDVI